jgi:hypothetical protein
VCCVSFGDVLDFEDRDHGCKLRGSDTISHQDTDLPMKQFPLHLIDLGPET